MMMMMLRPKVCVAQGSLFLPCPWLEHGWTRTQHCDQTEVCWERYCFALCYNNSTVEVIDMPVLLRTKSHWVKVLLPKRVLIETNPIFLYMWLITQQHVCSSSPRRLLVSPSRPTQHNATQQSNTREVKAGNNTHTRHARFRITAPWI